MCYRAGLDKLSSDTYAAGRGLDEHTIIPSLVFAWMEFDDLVNSLSEWFWVDDDPDIDDDNKFYDLIAKAKEYKMNNG